MENDHDGSAPDHRGRGISPALSDISELTILSRSPSPVSQYKAQSILSRSWARKPSDVSDRRRGEDGRFLSVRKKRAHTPETELSSKKPRTPDTVPRTLEATRKRYKYPKPLSPIPELSGPVSWVVGAGGLGTLQVLPKEVRQAIYGYAFGINRPVTIKECCGPETTRRERTACRKHGIGTKLGAGRFNIVQISKAVREEAAWVIFNYGSLHIDVNSSVNSYLDGGRSTTLRHLGGSNSNKQKMAMWTSASSFRFVNIQVPEHELRHGDPTNLTNHLLQVVCSLCKRWNDQCKAYGTGPSARSFVTADLGSIFHQMLPFNMESQASDRYDELLEWLAVHYSNEEPDFDQLAAESTHNLKRLTSIIGMHQDYAQWRVLVRAELEEKDEGGASSLHDFQVSCARNTVVFELST